VFTKVIPKWRGNPAPFATVPGMDRPTIWEITFGIQFMPICLASCNFSFKNVIRHAPRHRDFSRGFFNFWLNDIGPQLTPTNRQ
jgi:hypothetical protein